VTFRVPAGGQWQLYLWDGTSSRRLSEDYYFYQMNRTGEVVWDSGSALFLWDGATTRPLGDAGIGYPDFQLNDAGQVFWIGEIPGGSAVYRSDGATAEAISHTPEDEDPGVPKKHGLQISPTGHAVWVGDVFDESAEIFLYAPPAPGSLELDLPVVIGGRPTTGRVTLPAPAPQGGAVVPLANSNPAAAAMPPSVTVPAGMTMATFPVTTFPVRPSVTVTLSASFAGQIWTAMLELLRVSIDLPGGITQLTHGHGRNESPRLNDAGQVAWLAIPAFRLAQILLWTGPPIPRSCRWPATTWATPRRSMGAARCCGSGSAARRPWRRFTGGTAAPRGCSPPSGPARGRSRSTTRGRSSG
jgi:hypothetical protein